MKLKDGFLLVDKSKGITSHDVVDEVRRRTGEKRVGHAGTLDPNATGLLIVGVGRENTKRLGTITKDTTKTYIAEIFLGEERDTDDVEGKRLKMKDERKEIPAEGEIQKVLKGFVGEQDQMPPAYSAIKLKGKKAYELARQGEEVPLESRKVTIHSIKLIKFAYPILEIKTEVSSGTYIRSLARDIGRKLGTFGYLENLRRTKIGNYSVKDATMKI